MFFTPRYVKEARHYAEAARRIVRYRLDLLTAAQVASVEDAIAGLEQAARDRNRDAVKSRVAALEAAVGRVAPPRDHAGWRENVEVLLVAIVIAAGVRAYLLEPFKIPTGSMQPTLNGMIGTVTDTPPPNLLVRAFDFVFRGRTFLDVVGKEDDVVVARVRESSYLNYFTFTEIQGQRSRYTVFAPAAVVEQTFGIGPGFEIRKGEPLLRGYIDNGDFVLVNKLAYNFVPPQRGNVFVFRTTGIRGIEDAPGFPKDLGSQHYIKRLAGVPGDVLRVDDPNLFINGQLPAEKQFLRVMAGKDGYRGYSNSGLYLSSPDETFTVPPHFYFAMGDNSRNSSDSRYWGLVPEQNVTGKAFVVFWPFSNHWGFIE
ncbi:MAG TPA: signal peptidase I [Chthoniobacterales bacterium]|jgi:signal peptidase I